MKNIPLFFFLFLFCVVSVFTQQATPTPKSSNQINQTEFDTPRKPTKKPKTAEEFYEAARWENWNRRNEEAIKLLDQAISLKPDYLDAYFFRGFLKQRMNNCKAAIADFDTVIRLDQSVINTYQNRAECKMILKDWLGALADYDKSISNLAAKGLVQFSAFEGRGKLKYVMKDYDGAIADFTSAAKMNVNISANFLRALTYLKKGNPEGAIKDLTGLSNYFLESTKELRQKFPDQYSENKGYPSGENPLATLNKKEVQKSENGILEVVVGTGNILTMNNKSCKDCPGGKFAEFEDKIIPDGWFFSEDKIYFSLMLGMDNEEVIFYYLGDLLEKKGDTEGAIKAFTNSIVFKQYADGLIRFRRGKLLLRSKSFEPAVRDFSWAISQDRDFSEAYLERGIALQMLGHEALAQIDFAQYLQLNTSPDAKKILEKRIEEVKKQIAKPTKFVG